MGYKNLEHKLETLRQQSQEAKDLSQHHFTAADEAYDNDFEHTPAEAKFHEQESKRHMNKHLKLEARLKKSSGSK